MIQVSRKDLPVVISFYCGDRYYYDAAEKLREDCERLDIDCEIVELAKSETETWLEICRKKIPFYQQMMEKHGRPLLWMDVDCRLNQRPEFLSGSSADFAAFLRGFKYVRGFDAMSLSRFFTPSILFFNNTPAGMAFLKLMSDLESGSPEPGTDDFYLQEAWMQHEKQLRLMLLPPQLVSFEWPAKGDEMFYFGSSGNVAEFKGKASQHDVDLYTPARRKAVFLREAVELGKKKKPMEALAMLRRALETDPTDEALAYRIARLLRREGKLKTALIHLRRFQGPDFKDNHSRRFLADSEFEQGNIDRARMIALDLIERGTATDKAWANSRLLRFDLEARAKAAGVRDSERLPLWWMETPYPGNFGDILNPYIVEKLSGIPPRWVPKGKGNFALVIGSVIKFATKDAVVWGSGTPRMTDKLEPDARYLAVRGPLTRQLVLQSGGHCPEIYGDAAWFLPKLYTPKPTGKKHRLGLIRHFANDGDIDCAPEVKLISVMRGGYSGIEAFIDEIHECSAVLTTSLHGLIVCHAYGIPARWCEVPDATVGLPGDGTKFHDYMMSVGLEPEAPYLLPRGTTVNESMIGEAYRLPRRQLDLRALASVAPFKVLPEIMARL